MDISKTVPGFKPINIIRTCTRAQVYGSTVYGVWNKESNEYKFWGYFLSETSEDANQKCGKELLFWWILRINFSFSKNEFFFFRRKIPYIRKAKYFFVILCHVTKFPSGSFLQQVEMQYLGLKF